ncbi:MAG: C25 family cysteine peptidase [Candidatus Hatepunaea meridiana]|nr:C25 family cysteine peptidase [Candidatus Hatepunaea meridiana]
MKKRFCLFTVILLLLSVATINAAPYSKEDTSFLTFTQNGNSQVYFNCKTPAVELTTIEIDERSFSQLKTTADAIVGKAGGPALPAWSRWIEIPDGQKPILQIQTGDTEVINDIVIAPFPLSDNPNIPTTSSFSPDAYQQDILIPAEPASITQPMNIGGKRWAVVTISPYRYNPARRELHINDKLDVEITFKPDPQFTPQRQRPVVPAVLELEDALSNNPPRRDELSGRVDNLGGYVIIVPDEDDAVEAIEPLVEWKTRKGFVVTVGNLSDIGRSAGDIRDWLIEGYEEWDVPPTFVLLAGDMNGNAIERIPTYMAGGAPQSSWHASDNQYVRWDGADNGAEPRFWMPNGFIGRLPAERINHLQRMVAKIIAYESDPYVDDPWVEGAQLIAIGGARSGTHTNVAIRELMEGYGYQRRDLHETYSDQTYSDVNPITNNINNGVGFVNYRGYNPWGGFTQGHINGLRNRWMLPVVTGMVCGTNDFTQTWGGDAIPDCRGEAFVRAWYNDDAIGGVACFGPTDLYTHTWFNNTMDGEFYKALLVDNVSYLGALCVASKVALVRNYPSFIQGLGNGNSVGYYFYTYILFGDPSLQVRTREPIEIDADYPQHLPVGATYIDIAVFDGDEDPVEGAYVHIYFDEEVRYGAFTDEEGWVQLEIDPLEEGEYLITISGQNLVPVLGEIEVEQAPVYLSVDEITIDDDEVDDSQGNSDGFITPGETIELDVNLRNTGSDNCEGATVTLIIESPFVEFEHNEVEYEAIDSGEAGTGDQPFVFSLAPETPSGEVFDVELNISCGDEEWEAHFNLTVVGYNLEVRDYVFLDGNLYPGEEQELLVTIANIGELDTETLNAVIACSDPTIQIRQAETVFDPIESGESLDNDNCRFEVFASPYAYQGSEVSYGILLTDENGLRDSLVFTTILGDITPECPQGPDGYGYWAFDNRDTDCGMAPEYNWIQASNRVNISDGWVPDNVLAVDHGSRTTVRLPFDFVYYGREYNEITIGTNGWICLGPTTLISWNNQELGSGLAPATMVAPFWTDIWDGTIYTEYIENDGAFVIEWRNWSNSGQGQGDITFEIILYDPTTVFTSTGDGEIFFQYNEIPHLTNRDYLGEEQATIGICSHNREDLLEITHGENWDPRTADIESEMAIRFSTGEFSEFGAVEGRVRNLDDGQPFEDARVMIENTGFYDYTDEDGSYNIGSIPIGTYTVIASRRHYNDAVAADIQIIEERVQEVNFQMTFPTFEADRDTIIFGLRPDSSGTVSFDVWNDGNGPLDYEININYETDGQEQRDDSWDLMFHYNMTEVIDEEIGVNDPRLKGVAFDGELLYIAGAYEYGDLPHMIYVFNKENEFIRELDQFVVDPTSRYGYTEIAYNGENLLAIDRPNVLELTVRGDSVHVFNNPEGWASSIVWAPERRTVFTTSVTARAILEIDTSGEEVSSYDLGNPAPRTYGLSWFPEDSDGFPLYMFVWNDEEELGPPLQLMKLNPETGEIILVRQFDYDGFDNANDKPEGCCITKQWDPLRWVFIGLVNSPDGDRIFGVEIEPNLTWISIDPASARVPSFERQTINIDFFAVNMPEQQYYVILELAHNAVGDQHNIPTYFIIDRDWNISKTSTLLPSEFRFDPPKPNPFNPSTQLSFTLPKPAPVELNIYDISGRMIEQVNFGQMQVGRHYYSFDGSKLSSGIYIAKLETGTQTAIRKMVLIK